ncbi:MAG TPA: hypothetical protein VFV65_04730 [Gemmatimonadales bacterium]|nr:hypothetical protein [Gemmatimonadales bacterium]
MSRWSIPMLLLLAACSRQRDVTVEVTLPGPPGAAGRPAAEFMFVALPYNRDSLVAAFEARARTPRPATEALDSLFARYRAPFAAYTALTAEVTRYGDSLAALKERLAGLPRTDAAYGAEYARWVALRDTLRTLDAEAASARATLEAARPVFVARSESLRTAIRHWEDSTYLGYDRAVDSLVKATHRISVADTTDAGGRGVVRLRGNPWWIYARSWDPADPNAEWYWNVPVTSDTVRLDARTGINRPRY